MGFPRGGVKPYFKTQRAPWEDTTCKTPVDENYGQGAMVVATGGVKLNHCPPNHGVHIVHKQGDHIAVHYRSNGQVWFDIPNRFAPLHDECGRVLACVPGAKSAIRETGARCPVGYRRWVVTV